MKNPLNIPRLIGEIVAAVAIAETGISFMLPKVVPGVMWPTDAVLNGVFLMALAGPVIAWRVRCAASRAGQAAESEARPRPWKAIAAAAAVLGLGLALTAMAVRSALTQVHQEARIRFEHLTTTLVDDVQRPTKRCAHGLKSARGLYTASKSVERGEFTKFFAERNLATEFTGAAGFGFIQRVMRPDLDAFIAAEQKDEVPEFSVKANPPGPVGEGMARDLIRGEVHRPHGVQPRCLGP